MTLEHFITLGRSGLRVSPLCLGTMSFGEDNGWGASATESTAVLAEYLDRGGNFVDTANIYTNGHSEKIIGDYFASHSERRTRTVIATKFYCNLRPGDPNGGGAGRKALLQQLDNSLRRLQTDYIDLYWLHQWDRVTPVEETLRGLDDLVTSGKVRYIGFSDIPAWKVAEAQTIAHFRSWTPLIAYQAEYSLLERTAEGELVPMAQSLGIGVMPWGPLKGGYLSGRYAHGAKGESKRLAGPQSHHLAVIDAVAEIATQLGTSSASVALAWVKARPGIASTILGARTLDQLRDNLTALDVTLEPAQRERLDTVSKPTLNFPSAYNTGLGPMLAFGGMTVDGVTLPVSPFASADAPAY